MIPMNEKQKQKIETIINEMQCPKKFKCYHSNFDNICKSKDIGIETFLECLEDDPHNCPFAVPFADVFFCQCPLRVFIAKSMKK